MLTYSYPTIADSFAFCREPLIVDPHGHIDDNDRAAIITRFEQARGATGEGGPPMYIVSPYDRQGTDDALDTTATTEGENGAPKLTSSVMESMAWSPGFTSVLPEWVVLTRSVALAKKTRAFLSHKRIAFESEGWSAAFQDSATSFKAYSSLLRVEPELAVDAKSSSTGGHLSPVSTSGVLESAFTQSMRSRYLGPKSLRLKLYKNMRDSELEHQALLHDWRPVDALVDTLRNNFGSLALFFYNDLCSDVIAVLWRPNVFASKSFSVMGSEYAQPRLEGNWKVDTMVMVNGNDVLREMSQYYNGLVTKVKTFQPLSGPEQLVSTKKDTPGAGKRKAVSNWEEEESGSESEGGSDSSS
jgi:hypothetical protein